ncbi:MAG: deoxyribose-phosphate aldolase [Candidatus Wallbacteria bacterium HGW-Wallbacteria-1]|uniref:Deoxyribose-phosphate aldolase n=1 Tax=Candidatus Wallbacteria bacterium HGW-Wallbacteria-1 TaxID=2013854 RepID=A0A2N1PK35_9BACT|nr:MAG: deoxyribose-phosphate aldolase [Candidatus Wallbacteria bacterium HGW-Wallbacteria-1]
MHAGADRIGAHPGIIDPEKNMARLIDHTLLKPEATEDDVRLLCEEARRHTFASVCVNPGHVELSARLLAGCPVKVCTVIGFPLGSTTTGTKAFETREAIMKGAHEIDMVINVGALKAGNYKLVEDDIRAVKAATGDKILKVILETALLTDEEKIKACTICKTAGADFVKTSTGFGPGGATVEDIALMRRVVGPEMGVKASGGVRDTETARAMVKAGATRIGASASVKIVTGEKDDGKGY